MNKSLIDVPVLLWVFVRPNMIKRVFNVIKDARPTILFLISDGPRDNFPEDKDKIEASRKVVEDIDWECTVHKLYFEENKGIYPIHKITLEYIFERVDRCIFLEDDVVTSVSFFKFCMELLEKYKDDLRINMVCGMNHFGVYDSPNTDYFFTKGGAIWGFAIWRRTYKAFYDMNYGSDNYVLNRIMNNAKENKQFFKSIYEYLNNENYGGHKASFEFFLGLAKYSQNQLNIVPKRNMVCNIGYGSDAANTNLELKFLPKRAQQFFNMKTHEMTFPIKHPKYVVDDTIFETKLQKILGRTSFSSFFRKLEGWMRLFLFGNKRMIAKKILNKIM